MTKIVTVNIPAKASPPSSPVFTEATGSMMAGIGNIGGKGKKGHTGGMMAGMGNVGGKGGKGKKAKKLKKSTKPFTGI